MADNLLRSFSISLSAPGAAAALAAGVVAAAVAGCSARLDFEECPASPCAKGLLCVDGGCVLPPDPGCSPPEPPLDGPGTVVLGAIQNLTGELNGASREHQAAMRLAVEQANSSGALGERRLSMVWCDSRDEDTRVAASMAYLVDRLGTPAVVGLESSTIMLTHGPMAVDRGVLLMSHWATAEALSGYLAPAEGPTLIWRTAPNDRFQAAALARVVERACVKPEELGVAYRDDEYGKGLLDGLAAALCAGRAAADCFPFARLLPDVQVDEAAGEDEARRDARVAAEAAALATEVERQRQRIKALAVLGFQREGAALLEALAAKRLALPLVVSEDLMQDSITGSALARRIGAPIVGANPGLAQGRAWPRFARAMRGRADRGAAADRAPVPFAAHAYDAVISMALAIAATPPGRPVTGRALAEGLARLSAPEAPRWLASELSEAAAVLRSGPAAVVNLDGASGDVDFDPALGEATGASIEPNVGDGAGGVCAATDLGFACSPTAPPPRCRPDCTAPFPDLPADAHGAPLLLGGLLSMSGANTVLGASRRHAMELALDHLNAPGVGRPVQMVLCDVETDVELALRRADEVVAERATPALVGPPASSMAFAVAPRAAAAGITMVAPSATAVGVTTSAPPGPDGARRVWRTAPSDAEQARRLAQFIQDAGGACVRRLALVYRNDVYGIGLRTGIEDALCPDGACDPDYLIPHVLPEQTSDDGIRRIVDAIAAADPPADAVALLPFRGEGLTFLRQVRAAADAGSAPSPPWPVVASETLMAEEVAKAEGIEGIVIYGTSPGLARGPGWADMATPFQAQFGAAPDSFAASYYDAVVMLGLASATVPREVAPSGAALSLGLSRLSDKRPGAPAFRPRDLRDAAAALAAGPSATIDYAGASGDLDLDPATGEASAEVPMFVVRDGALSRYEPDAAGDSGGAGGHPLCD